MPFVSRISIAPVKGLALVHPDEVTLEETGVVANRRFHIVDAEGRRYNQLRNGHLVRIKPEYDPERAGVRPGERAADAPLSRRHGRGRYGGARPGDHNRLLRPAGRGEDRRRPVVGGAVALGRPPASPGAVGSRTGGRPQTRRCLAHLDRITGRARPAWGTERGRRSAFPDALRAGRL
ncbi:MAG: hypothetical protein E6G33_12035 [Actinobacteria bacterium]|nr:MAG: hypothetical protein E6G33_12035 [Actinomycetota bacterium]